MDRAAAAAELGATRAEQADRWTYRGFTFGALVEYPPKQDPVLKVFVVTSSPLSFALRTETSGDHLAKNIGFASEFQTGDRGFDAAVYVESDSVPSMKTLLASERCRYAVQAILASDFAVISHVAGILTAESPDVEPDASTLARVVAHLVTVAERVEHRGAMRVHAPTPRSSWLAALTSTDVLVSIGLFAGGFALSFAGAAWWPVHDTGALIKASLLVGAVVVVAVMAVVIMRRWGTASAHKDLFVTTILLVFTVPVAVCGTTVVLNGALDSSASSTHTVLALDKWTEPQKNAAPTYHVLVMSWSEPGGLASLGVPAWQYAQVNPGSTWLTLHVHRGFLGFEWSGGFGVARERVTSSPDPAMGPVMMGWKHLRDGRVEPAIFQFNQAITLADDTRGYHGRGVARLRKGDELGAREDLRRAIELAPWNADAQRWLDRIEGGRR